MKFDRRTLMGASLAAAALLAAPAVMAAPGSWSSEPVRIVVTFPPGGTSDLVARLLAKHLDADHGQKAVVDNRPGAAGTVAADYVSKQDPDGTALLLANNAPFTIAPTRFKSIPYKPIEGFTHVAYIGASAPGLFVQPSLGIKTVEEYIAYAKKKQQTYGSSGVARSPTSSEKPSMQSLESSQSTSPTRAVHQRSRTSAPASSTCSMTWSCRTAR